MEAKAFKFQDVIEGKNSEIVSLKLELKSTQTAFKKIVDDFAEEIAEENSDHVIATEIQQFEGDLVRIMGTLKEKDKIIASKEKLLLQRENKISQLKSEIEDHLIMVQEVGALNNQLLEDMRKKDDEISELQTRMEAYEFFSQHLDVFNVNNVEPVKRIKELELTIAAQDEELCRVKENEEKLIKLSSLIDNSGMGAISLEAFESSLSVSKRLIESKNEEITLLKNVNEQLMEVNDELKAELNNAPVRHTIKIKSMKEQVRMLTQTVEEMTFDNTELRFKLKKASAFTSKSSKFRINSLESENEALVRSNSLLQEALILKGEKLEEKDHEIATMTDSLRKMDECCKKREQSLLKARSFMTTMGEITQSVDTIISKKDEEIKSQNKIIHDLMAIRVDSD